MVCRVEILDKVQAIGLCRCFPAVMCCGVTFPSKEVLQLVVASDLSGSKYLFDLVFWLVVDEFWGWFWIVLAMFRCFCIWG
jgi:hypothetical protein